MSVALPSVREPRVAIVHDWLVTYAGSERVVEQLCRLYPQADLFTLFADPRFVGETPWLRGRKLTTSVIQRLPGGTASFRRYLALMPLAVEQFDLSGYDLVLSSSHAVAKGVLTGPDQLHISYVHSPMRYAWDLQHQYLREAGLDHGAAGWAAKAMLHRLRIWDVRTANGVDQFIANSHYIARRIRKAYGREAAVIYPPVDVDAFELREDKADYYFTASRFVPYKRVDLIVDAFARMPDKRLVVIGDGPENDKIRAKATPNVELMGYQPFEVLKAKMQGAKAFVFAAEEDFGILPVEAQACGTPVVAFGKGGALETVRGMEHERPTGVFFARQQVPEVVQAVATFEAATPVFTPAACRSNARRFSAARFCDQLDDLVRARSVAATQDRMQHVGQHPSRQAV